MNKLTLATLALWIAWLPIQAETATIAKNGKSEAAIVVAGGSSISVQHAAAELASILSQVTGAKFEIVDRVQAGKSNLLVGQGAAKLVDPRFSTDGLGEDGLIIRTSGNDLILAGGEPRGTLYAVYAFLEDYVGCHWWTPQVSLIPKKPNLSVGELNKKFVPLMEHRDIMIMPNTKDPDWSVRNKCVGEMHGFRNLDIMPERGGCQKAHPCGHDYFTILPPDKYFGDHPEWYSLIEGKRVASPSVHANLCLTNPEMQKTFAENLVSEVHKGPSYYPPNYVNRVPNPLMFVAVTPEDDSGYPCRCQCDNCVAVEKAEGSPAGLNLRFANQMAKTIKSQFPDKTVTMYAYHFTRKPPKITRPDPNVLIYYCPIHAASNSTPMTDPKYKEWDNDLRGWLKISKKVYIYDYPDNVVWELVPHPNLRALAANIKYWAKLGVKGYFGDGMSGGNGGTEMAELRAWMVAKLLWDPSLDPNKVIREFTDGYYGPAGKEIVAYLNVMHDAVEVSKDLLDLGSPPDAQFLSIETLTAGWAHLKAAEDAVKDDPALLSRVKIAQLPVLFVLLGRWDQLKDDASCRDIEWPLAASRDDAYKAFMDVVAANNLSLNPQSTGMLAKGGK